MIGIFNASPLIYLGKIGAIFLIKNIFDECFTTEIVKNEVLNKSDAPEIPILVEYFKTLIKVKIPKNKTLVKRLESLEIHSGEATVIALAKEMLDNANALFVILDEETARDVAKTLRLEVTGTIGLLLRAYRLKLIDLQKTKQYLFNLVENTTFRISSDLLAKILRELDE